jgi:hypothetical protein
MAPSSSRNNARAVQGDDATIRTLYTSHSRDVSVRPPMGWSGRALPCQRASRVTRLPMFGRFRGIGTTLPCPRAPPANGWPMAKAEQRSPLLQAHYTALKRYYGLLRPCAPRPLGLAVGAARAIFLRAAAWQCAGSHVPYECLVELHAAYVGCRPVYQVISRVDPGRWGSPRF